tara:strand:- start:24 stop:317 length:294 start_codon:yes stop_codon:yes gene_type:complete
MFSSLKFLNKFIICIGSRFTASSSANDVSKESLKESSLLEVVYSRSLDQFDVLDVDGEAGRAEANPETLDLGEAGRDVGEAGRAVDAMLEIYYLLPA